MAVTKVIELIGKSTESWEDAARSALAAAGKSLHGITGIQVMDWSAKVVDSEIVEYRADVKISFTVD